MAGPRQPIDLVKAKGKKHLTKTEIEERRNSEVKAATNKIEAPAYLKKSQKNEFNKIAIELLDMGIMSNLDCDVLAQYITSREMYIKLTKELRKSKNSGEDLARYERIASLQDKYFKQCITVARELGLTISSRCRLVAPASKEPPKQNKFDKFQKGVG
ncbi:MAG: phage terminase small subunit P27 family [Eubacteriales bacterium]|nr:phage terminase small subunit P27 family [Eubacteriales bacterium]MDD4390308.1 phage terminase small subunit P27 family [Eubacteriales bacterium]